MASLKYTKPASALPEVDHARTSLTSLAKTNLDEILSYMFEFFRTSSAYLPAGTLEGSPTAILFTLSVVKSLSDVISVSDGPTKTSLFFTRFLHVSSAIRDLSFKVFICFWPAEINTSAGAPCSICCCSDPEAPKLNVNCTSGYFSVNNGSISPIASFKLAAAEIVSSTG